MERITTGEWVDACMASPNDLDTTEFNGSWVKDNGDRVYWTEVDTPEFEYVYKCVPRNWTKQYYMGSK